MTSLLAARCKDFAAAFGFHANAEAVRLGAAAFARLIGALWQNNPPCSTQAVRDLFRLPSHTSAWPL
jgi:hypothetical protein